MEGFHLYDVRETERARARAREINQQSIETVHFFGWSRLAPPARRRPKPRVRASCPSDWGFAFGMEGGGGLGGVPESALQYYCEPRLS